MDHPLPPPIPPVPPVPPALPGMPLPPPFQPPRNRNWFERNWPWFVPVGCVSLLVVLALFFVGIFAVVMTAIKSSDAYKTAIQRARTNPQVIEALGTPVTEGFFVSGNTQINNGSGHANLSVPLSGPRGKGTLYAVADKAEGLWRFSRLQVRVDGSGEIIDLLTPGAGDIPGGE